MRLSRKSDYAIRALRYISGLGKGKLGSINSVAEGEKVPREFLAKILKDLTRAGILVSYQGVKGGYALAIEPKDLNFLTVIEAIDGPIHLILCTEPDGCKCTQYDVCDLKEFWLAQENSLKKALSRQNFGRYRKGRK